jgi:hypothetical protein
VTGHRLITRTDVRLPEDEQHRYPIEAAFKIGDQLYALEHTGVEPFDGHIKMEAEAKRLFEPIENALIGNLDNSAEFELAIPVNALRGRPKREIESIQKATIEWVKATAPSHAAENVVLHGLD